jgi:FAD:protein FMN transferase
MRRFARILALCLTALTCISCTAQPNAGAGAQRFEFDRPLMGTRFRLVFYADDATHAQAAADAAFARIDQLNHVMSDYDPTSELSRLSHSSGQGTAVHVSDELWAVLAESKRYWELSGGAFDVTVGPIVRLWRRARRLHELPRERSVKEALDAVGFDHVRMNEKDHTVELTKPNMLLDLGGIAKGYACDRALDVLRAHGYGRALVDGGGDLALGDPPPGKAGWRIGAAPIPHLGSPTGGGEEEGENDGPPTRYLLLANVGIATSGDAFQYVQIDGKRYSHLVDPKTGVGLTDHSGVTVVAPTGTAADALASAVSVLGPKKGLALIESLPGTAALILRKPADTIETYESSRFKTLPVAPTEETGPTPTSRDH